MVNIPFFRKLALSFPDTDEHPHFDRQAFRVKKKIFATLHTAQNRAMLVLSPVEQSVYCSADPLSFFPVPGAWGKKGCTLVSLETVKTVIFKEALLTAYTGILAKTGKTKKDRYEKSNPAVYRRIVTVRQCGCTGTTDYRKIGTER